MNETHWDWLAQDFDMMLWHVRMARVVCLNGPAHETAHAAAALKKIEDVAREARKALDPIVGVRE